MRICIRQLRLFLEQYGSVPVDALVYCTGEANYGGRVTDDKDRRCLNALLLNFYNENALLAGYCFVPEGAPDADKYKQPEADSHADYLNSLRALPMNTSVRLSLTNVLGEHGYADVPRDGEQRGADRCTRRVHAELR